MQETQPAKLVVVSRRDLSEGLIVAQSIHAAIGFVFENPARAGPWYYNSNYLIVKEVENEKELKALIRKCKEKDLVVHVFKEPDLDNQITSIAIEPSRETQKLVAKLPLLFQRQNYEERIQSSIKDISYQSQGL